MENCPREECFAPESGCDFGFLDLSKCSFYSQRQASKKPSHSQTAGVLLPWSGAALGLSDLGFVSCRAKPTIVGILGAQNAGKTTILAAWYLLLGRGELGTPGRKFSGSYSLAGWEAVAGSLRWSPGHKPNFPPHTSSQVGRAPGLLHLAFREDKNPRREFLFTDAPGEWFQKWAVNMDSPESEGARWVASNADAFIIVVDREALADSTLGATRNSLQLLARRVNAESRGRPVAVVWTKSDFKLRKETESSIRSTMQRLIPSAKEFNVSVDIAFDKNADGFRDLFAWATGTERGCIYLPSLGYKGSDLVFHFGAT